jgi:hypothetical protein
MKDFIVVGITHHAIKKAPKATSGFIFSRRSFATVLR